MPSWVETIQADDTTTDRPLNSAVIRRFYVDTPAHAAFSPGVTNVVQRGDQHPRILTGTDPTYFADSFRVAYQTPNSCEIEVEYTREAAVFNGGGWPGGNVALQQKAHKRETLFKTAEMEIPTVREWQGKPLGSPAGTPTQRMQEIVNVKLTESRIVNQLHVTLPDNNATIKAAIKAQHNAIHFINGAPQRFEAGDITQHGPGEWRVLYSWYEDDGTRALDARAKGEVNLIGSTNGEPSNLPNPVIYGPAADPTKQIKTYFPPKTKNLLTASMSFGDTGDYIRSPFHKVEVVLHMDLPPVFIQFCPLRFGNNPANGPNNGLGWQLLPGAPQP